MSALFWWSAEISSTGWPSTLPPKSSIAIWMAVCAALAFEVGVQARQVADVADHDLLLRLHSVAGKAGGAEHEGDDT